MQTQHTKTGLYLPEHYKVVQLFFLTGERSIPRWETSASCSENEANVTLEYRDEFVGRMFARLVLAVICLLFSFVFMSQSKKKK